MSGSSAHSISVQGLSLPQYRPPAVPLVTVDPYFSIWSMNDQLTEDSTKHWTGANHSLSTLLRIDGQTYRVMGRDPQHLPPMEQTQLLVHPTRTIYEFAGAGIGFRLIFTTPSLPDDLAIMARPITYITGEAWSIDGQCHQVSMYFDAAAEIAVDTPNQMVVWSRHQVGELSVLRMGSRDQRILEKWGDNTRIDWGHLYLTTAPDQVQSLATVFRYEAFHSFTQTGKLPESDDLRTSHPAQTGSGSFVLAVLFDFGEVGNQPTSHYLVLAYDDVFSVEYLHRRLRPFWHRKGMEIKDLLLSAIHDYDALMERCNQFDTELMTDLVRVGGAKYAQLSALSFRQCLAAHKLVADDDGTPLFFSKENFSNGCIATVDVTYPASPFYLLFNPDLLVGCIKPILDYANSNHWKFDFAPHDLGTYPLANGQVYGGAEQSTDDQMPVEECGNMIILVAALSKRLNDASLATAYWPVLTRWAEYLKSKGFDPENQLCTDDFAGHLAHNVNLSLKAIIGLGSYALLCDMQGLVSAGQIYRKTAEEYALMWLDQAKEADHTRLAFDQPNTWSQKYNLVWDKLLDLNLFPAELARQEVAFYRAKQNQYGLPLDSRSDYTKLDWIVWSATLADDPEDFEALVNPLLDWANATPTRVPLTDWYWTTSGAQVGFQARSVVGGIFIKLLESKLKR